MRTQIRLAALGLAIAPFAVALATACGGPRATGAKAKPAPVSSEKFTTATRCDASAPGRELSYHDLHGTGRPDMVEVIAYAKTASGSSEGRVVCMEIDTNRDGSLDVLRVFTDKGEIESEEADRNHDGKSDVWITYENGFVAKQSYDTKFTGKPDEFHYYKDGKLKRIERDRNGDGKPDVWEHFANARLERMGVDFDFDGRIDVWYRDELARAEQKKLAGGSSAAPAGSASAAPSSSTN